MIEPDQPFIAIGSGGNYAYAAANALYNNTDLSAEELSALLGSGDVTLTLDLR